MKRKLLGSLAVLGLSISAFAQGSTEYEGGMKVKLNDDGSKYFRLITWHQAWLTASENSQEDYTVSASLRRSRFLMYAQINDKFLILTHFGLNSLNANNMDPVGKSSSAQLFMHDAWVDYTVAGDKLHLGAGLHYWNGISRLSNQSTLNILTLDAPRFNWATIGTSDQFARHMGIFAKGKLGKLDYRVAMNNPLTNTLDAAGNIALSDKYASYQGRSIYGDTKANYSFQGYFNYQFKDQESNLLPYFVGSYLGGKKVFNVGAGFFAHPNGSVSLNNIGDTISHNVNLFGIDVFDDRPVGEKGAAITTYLAAYFYDYGPNYSLRNSSNVIGTGNIYYLQSGYLLPKFSEKGKLQPYIHASYRDLEAFKDAATTFGVGANWFISGHNAKLTLEYQQSDQGSNSNNLINFQAMIYL
jgi:hypothetical protein